MWNWAKAKEFAKRYKDVFEITPLAEIKEDLKLEPYFANKIRCLDNEDGDERYQAELDLDDELEDAAILVQETYECKLNSGYTPNFEIHKCLGKYHDICKRLGVEPNDLMFIDKFELERKNELQRRMEYW